MIVNDDNDVIRVVRNDLRVWKHDHNHQAETKRESSNIRPELIAATGKYDFECPNDC